MLPNINFKIFKIIHFSEKHKSLEKKFGFKKCQEMNIISDTICLLSGIGDSFFLVRFQKISYWGNCIVELEMVWSTRGILQISFFSLAELNDDGLWRTFRFFVFVSKIDLFGTKIYLIGVRAFVVVGGWCCEDCFLLFWLDWQILLLRKCDGFIE